MQLKYSVLQYQKTVKEVRWMEDMYELMSLCGGICC